MIILGEEWLAA